MSEFKDQYVNGPQGDRDPLKAKTDKARRELFKRLSKQCNGFTQRDVVYAALNLILNAIRQECASARQAESYFDEMAYKGKATLLGEHYSRLGARRNVFPFDQHITATLVDGKRT